MTGRYRSLVAVPALLLAVAAWHPGHADDACTDGERLQQGFPSGASWSLCLRPDDQAGLVFGNMRYRAPGDHDRKVADTVQLAQILLHDVASGTTIEQIGSVLQANSGLGAANQESVVAYCSADTLAINARDNMVCSEVFLMPLLSRYSVNPEVTGHRWRLSAQAQRGFAHWRYGLDLTADGRISPWLVLTSHPVSNHSQGLTVLASWRMNLALDDEALRAIRQYDFRLDASGSRRPMHERDWQVEGYGFVERESFTVWQLQGTRGGYLLDPANSGFAWPGQGGNWTRSDLAVTRRDPCQRQASQDSNCDQRAGNLDDYIDGESLPGQDLSLWYQQSRPIPPLLPAVSLPRMPLSFTLLPFDWTDASPFEGMAQ